MSENMHLFLISFFGVIFILQLIMSIFFSDIDIGADIGDMDISLELGDIFSLKGVTNFCLGTSVASYKIGFDNYTEMILSSLCGLGLVIILALLYKLLSKLQYTRKYEEVKDIIGREAIITSRSGDFIMIQIELNGSLEEVEAKLSEFLSEDEKNMYNNGTVVHIVNMVSNKYIIT